MKQPCKQLAPPAPVLMVVQPHNIEAEEAVLGSLILESNAIMRVRNILTADCFYKKCNSAIYSVICDLSDSGVKVDMITVSQKIIGILVISEAGGVAYVSGLAMAVQSTYNLEKHALFLVELTAKRRLLDSIDNAKALLAAGADVVDIYDNLQQSTAEGAKLFNPVGSDLSKLEIHFSDAIPEPDPILKQGDALVISRGNISAIKGKAKSRKSFLSTLLIASAFGNESFGLQSGMVGGTVLLIDTEQASAHVQKVVKRIYRLCGWSSENENMKVLALREFSVRDRQIILEKAIRDYRPDFVILDGAVDIIADFNNADESKQVIGLLMRLSTEFNCHICGVLHEGKGNGELRGHYGAEALNKAETVFQVDRQSDTSIVSANATRNMPFDDFSFFVGRDGLPILGYVENPKTTTDKKADSLKYRFGELIAGYPLTYTELRKAHSDVTGMTQKTAEADIKSAVEKGILLKEYPDKYRFNP